MNQGYISDEARRLIGVCGGRAWNEDRISRHIKTTLGEDVPGWMVAMVLIGQHDARGGRS